MDLRPGADLPDEVSLLADHDLRGSNEVYGVDESDRSFAGDVADAARHQFVDVRTRGEHRAYVVD